ncbi:hypothetical protein KR222_004579, partial [Zaprionus bogoriensis]
ASYYTAGVVEFRSSSNWTDNLSAYLEIISSANVSEADIIVFPEMTLASLGAESFAPAPELELVPCLSDPNAQYYGQYVVAISCAARNVSKYVVINFSERQLCDDTPEDSRPCAANGYNVFNTNLVFDRRGAVISRYRKWNLYGEPRNTTYAPEHVTFETDFNVTFGHFICFDIMFYTPVQDLVVQGVRDFIYPTMWFSQLPFLTAVQVQQGWAYSNNVNLLAAGSSNPSVGSTGTGIYHGRAGTVSSVVVVGEGERRVYVAQVPKFVDSAELRAQRGARRQRRSLPRARAATSENFFMKRDYLEQYTTFSLSMVDEAVFWAHTNQTVCDQDFCCSFDLEWRTAEATAGSANSSVYGYSYRLGAYDGMRNEDNGDSNYVRNCALFACTGSGIEDCGKLSAADWEHRVTFTKLAIEATYPNSSQFLPMPNSVLDSLKPLEPTQFKWTQQQLENGNEFKLRYELAESVELSNLLTFAIYGNYFDDDCTYGKGTAEQDVECGYKPADSDAGGGGAASGLRFSNPWLQFLLAVSVVIQLMFD